MSNLNDFNREAKAALWVVLQWLLLAVPTGLVCGAVGTAFHLSVEYVTELRAAQSWLLLCLPLAGLAIVALYKVTKCEGVGTNNVIRAVQSGEPVSLLLVPAIFWARCSPTCAAVLPAARVPLCRWAAASAGTWENCCI